MQNLSDMPVVALAGNPNVGKSTIFNALTGMNQHTGNWPGKTVQVAQGVCDKTHTPIKIVDIPGTYSLLAHSSEEEVARDFLCFSKPYAVVVVCDATCLERNMNLVLQIMEVHKNVIVCVNLLDEAARKGISVDLKQLEKRLGVRVVGTSAHNKKTLNRLVCAIDEALCEPCEHNFTMEYDRQIETSIKAVEKELSRFDLKGLSKRWLAMRLLESDPSLNNSLLEHLGGGVLNNPSIFSVCDSERKRLISHQITDETFKDMTVSAFFGEAARICASAIEYKKGRYSAFDLKMDRFFTGRKTGYPIMLLLLLIVLWITVFGANYPSGLLSSFFTFAEAQIDNLLISISVPDTIRIAFTQGIFRVTGWVVSVMLPPMAIFFPLFTLLEDSGYLPRIAFCLDNTFRKCNACGKQALTMCMGFGCNAVGVTGCRIIDSPREKLLATLTNSFVPCNGRLPQPLIWKFFVLGAEALFLLRCFAYLVLLISFRQFVQGKTPQSF